ncbi:carbohydrate-binding module family 50 protein [Serpula lacrymans var. lacrymans S7.3]|uniref:Carbohydrate-binding module family 50 protein n=2 Tax=Serpula lacrymans var. lacrymans TaxID=341189 RepID=F8QDR1_SERL3|nr:uncharacterized protein SERLADRAFT_480326 [Serpula lacrymans var. lacrymans S7.9]EGN93732.1 carbohydrate-binding module family 50 protein [Serpula lacrymans var. lacrymans S7.3]EGO19101.1 hypothetical protein SERLADRAFT_480326 [Serpula lacrymans var. lacrymans S7.9]
MGRWTQYDEDDYRLPEGMKRVGYDSDSSSYYFRSSDGSLYKGAEGAEFGQLTRVSEVPITIPEEGDEGDDLEAAPSRQDGYQSLSTDENASPRQRYNTGAYRTLFPFFLIIAVVLLLVWRLVFLPTQSAPSEPCPDKTLPYYVKSGDTCWDISKAHKCSLDDLLNANPEVRCEKLLPGKRLCVPEEGSGTRRRRRYT